MMRAAPPSACEGTEVPTFAAAQRRGRASIQAARNRHAVRARIAARAVRVFARRPAPRQVQLAPFIELP